MPELPEVETVRMGLAPALVRHRLVRVETRRGDLRRPFPPCFAQRLTGRIVTRLARRAKYLLAELDGGETLVVHLGMSGHLSVYDSVKHRKQTNQRFELASESAGRGKHDHVIIETDAPALIVLTDHRRFGLMTMLDTATLGRHPLFRDLGIEPLSDALDATYLARQLKGKRTPIKSALQDQGVIAGLGNIYACESLFRAGISPKRSSSAITGAPADELVRAIKSVLHEAIEAGGSSLRNYAKIDGALGEFQHRFAVYGRTGAPCLRPSCGGRIKRIVQAGRSSFYCPRCQR